MKMKINKACDLSSISVLPPHTRRRSSTLPAGPQSSQQLRSQQQSQQSFSQSQHGMFSQFSQNSLDEIVASDQRFGSQERENSMKRISCLAPASFAREESQIPIPLARSSTSLARKWSSASAPDHRCQMGEDLEHRIGIMETSLTRFGMILDSIQSDVMQVNKGMKEFSMEMEGLRQKLVVHENSLLLLNKGHEDIKASLDAALKFISDHSNQDLYREKLQQSFTMISALPEQIEACLLKVQNELCKTIIKEMEETARSLNKPIQKYAIQTFVPPLHSNSCCGTPLEKPRRLQNETRQILHDSGPMLPTKVRMQATLPPKVEMGSWNSVKRERTTFPDRNSNMQHIQNRVSPFDRTTMMQERECRVIIDSDEEIDGGFSCLILEKESGNNLAEEEVKEEAERILRKARKRKRKRKHSNTIILN